jgi:Mn2+/Fe2+ NRAMP family transporter
MLLVLATATAMVTWIILWSLGVKGFDGFLVGLLLVLMATTAYIVLPFMPGNRKGKDEPVDPAPFN